MFSDLPASPKIVHLYCTSMFYISFMDSFSFLNLYLQYISFSGAPIAERGPGASSNVTELWFYKVQNWRRKCCCLVRKMIWSQKKRSSPKFQRFFRPKSSCLRATSMGLSLLKVIWMGHLMGPLNSMGPGVIVPPCPPLVGPVHSISTPQNGIGGHKFVNRKYANNEANFVIYSLIRYKLFCVNGLN